MSDTGRISSSSSTSKDGMDLEKATSKPELINEAQALEDMNDNVPRDKFAKLWSIVMFLDKYGVEARGIERVPPDQRTQTSPLAPFWMWLAANMTISTFAIGVLAQSIFFLGLKEAALTIIFFNLLCTLPVAYFSTWGAKLGLRQLTLSRFSFGYATAQLPIVLNCIACVGWSIVNSIVGAQTLRAVSTSHQIPTAAGIVVIAILTIVVSFMGYRVVHLYEQYSWIPVVIIFFIYLGQIARFTESDFGGSGSVEAGNVLSFGATVAGFALGWTSLAADYTVRMPEDMSSYKIFFWTYLGLNTPLILVEILGAAAMTTFVQKPTWEDAYNGNSVGGLLGAGLAGPMGGFGSFLLVLLALSIVANNIPNMYSLALTFQNLHPYAQAIPRIVIVIIGSVIYIVLAIVGASHFEEWLDTLLVILSYWLAIFSTILIEEHLIFRKGKWSNYVPGDFNNWRKLPLGVASFLALGCGVAGAILGMAQVWYVGVIGRMIGDPEFGGDIGFEMAFAFTAVTYPPLRYLEKSCPSSKSLDVIMILPAFLSRYLQQLWADKDRSYKLKDAVYLFILFSSSELHPNMCLLAFVFLTTFIAPAYCGYCFENCANSTSINPSTMIIIFVTIAAVIIALSFIFALVRYQRIKQFQRDIVQNAAFGASTIPTSYILPTQPGLMHHSLHHHAHHQHAHNDVNMMSMQNMQTTGMMGAGVT